METRDYINNAEYLIRQCLNRNPEPIVEAWLRDACLDLAQARNSAKDTGNQNVTGT